MGLTIQYRIRLGPEQEEARVLEPREFVARLHARALRLQQQGRVDGVGPIRHGPEVWQFAPYWARYWHPERGGWASKPVFPLDGWLFWVEVGQGCESLRLGLCRYPPAKPNALRRRRKPVEPVWRLEAFCKTQYASLHGWEHFRRCHLAVIRLLGICRRLGAKVTLSDEGGYWPRCSERQLRRNLGEMNALVASAAGALKDSADARHAADRVEAPIFSHPQFERLEAEGAGSPRVRTYAK
jgi:hypothetical protein